MKTLLLIYLLSKGSSTFFKMEKHVFLEIKRGEKSKFPMRNCFEIPFQKEWCEFLLKGTLLYSCNSD